jgi:protein-S-isoprenylcysteine O-methyltransferase Ste14
MGSAQAIARRRVPLGFVVAAIALVVADPTWESWRAGLAVALVGEALRVWAAGHLEKSREVTTSGPYRWLGHPLYVGSALIAVGVVIAARHVVVTAVAFAYMIVTLGAAVRTEESFLRERFGETYDAYRASRAEPTARRFTLERALRNREYRAMAGLAAGFALLALKILGNL